MPGQGELRISIVGSGLAGLAAARVLREKHNVTIFERGGPATATGGQGITIFPNSIKLLGRLNWDPDRAGAVSQTGLTIYGIDGQLLQDYPIDYESKWGAPALTMRRSDFRVELLRLATAPSEVLNIPGQPANAVFNTAVASVDPEEGSIMLEDGRKIESDVVIVADGIHSKLRQVIVGEGHLPRKGGLTCFRIAITAEEVQNAFGQLPTWWKPNSKHGRGVMYYAKDTRRVFFAYPLRNSECLNISCIFPIREDRGSITDSWYADGDRTEILDVYKDFPKDAYNIISIAKEVKVWDLQDLDPLPTWTQGRVLLIGDAAHAMTPMQGQGANMAMEDADSLRLLLDAEVTKDKVPGILKKIDSIRRPRAAHVLQDTRELGAELDMEKRMAKYDYNYGYDGIYSALEGRK